MHIIILNLIQQAFPVWLTGYVAFNSHNADALARTINHNTYNKSTELLLHNL